MGLYDDPTQMYGGIFDAQMGKAVDQRGLMALAAGLLQASQPSSAPQSFGAGVGQAATQAMGARSQATNELLRAKLIKEQVESSTAERKDKERKAAARQKFAEKIPGLFDEAGQMKPGAQNQLATGLFDIDPGAAVTLLTKEPGGFTLGEGQSRYGQDGRLLASGPPKAATPYSELAKLKADLDAGRITQGQFDAAYAKATRIPQGEQDAGPLGGSADARALMHLVNTGQMTMQQAAMWLASKTAAGPNGQLDIVSPMAMQPGASSARAAAPGEAPPPPNPGIQTVRPGVPKPVEYTQEQGNAYTYSERVKSAGATLDGLMAKGYKPSAAGNMVSDLPGANYFKGADRQQFEQAERDLVNAILRKESGATISDAEFANARRQYIPQPGDTPEVLAQKKANRETVYRTLRAAAGPGRDKVEETPSVQWEMGPDGVLRQAR